MNSQRRAIRNRMLKTTIMINLVSSDNPESEPVSVSFPAAAETVVMTTSAAKTVTTVFSYGVDSCAIK